MPHIRRAQVLQELKTVWSDAEAEAVLVAALRKEHIRDRPTFKPDEVARLGRVLMELAAKQHAAAPGLV